MHLSNEAQGDQKAVAIPGYAYVLKPVREVPLPGAAVPRNCLDRLAVLIRGWH